MKIFQKWNTVTKGKVVTWFVFEVPRVARSAELDRERVLSRSGVKEKMTCCLRRMEFLFCQMKVLHMGGGGYSIPRVQVVPLNFKKLR